MPKIKINPEILMDSSKKIAAQVQELNTFNGKLSTLLNEIHEKWKGNSSNKYYELMQGYHKKAVHMESVLTEFKQYADTAVAKFEALDQECANKINNSF